ncbi:MAG: hypothetical protein WAU70_04125, partial [Flavobacteriales bacterium]
AALALVGCKKNAHDQVKADLLSIGIELSEEATLTNHYEDATLTDYYESYDLKLTKTDVLHVASRIRERVPFIDSITTSQQIAPFEHRHQDTTFSIGYRTSSGYALEVFEGHKGKKFTFFQYDLDTTAVSLKYTVFVN